MYARAGRRTPLAAASRCSLTCIFNGLGAAALSYVGQGMIMGPKTGLSMMLGAIVGWAVLGPLSKSEGWAPGDIDSYRDGARGYASFATPFVVESSASQSLAGGCPGCSSDGCFGSHWPS